MSSDSIEIVFKMFHGRLGSNSDFHNIAEQKEESAEAKSNLSPTVV
jgi:hypothetical protein